MIRDNNDIPYEPVDESVLGPSKTREETLEEIKEQKRAKRAAEKEAAKLARAERKASADPAAKKDLLIMGVILAAVVIGAAVILGMQITKETKASKFEPSEEHAAHFYDTEAVPELSEEGLTAAVNEVYYTKGGHLCVKMTIGNGLDRDQTMTALEVKISNGDTDELIASGYTSRSTLEVAAGGTAKYTFYISPEYVKIPDDSLYTITYSVTATGTYDEE